MIVLTILKVIGGILLLFLLLILLLLAVILFVPIRYASEGYKGEELTDYSINFKAYWLMKIVRFKAVYTDEGLQLLLKVLWITLMKSPEEDEPQEEAEALKEEDLEETEFGEYESREATEALREAESMEETEPQADTTYSSGPVLESDETETFQDKTEDTGLNQNQISVKTEKSSESLARTEETSVTVTESSEISNPKQADVEDISTTEADITDEVSVIEPSDDIEPVEPDQEKEPSETSEQSPEQAPDSKKSNTGHIIEKTLLDKIKEQFAAFLGRIKDVVQNINKIREQINDPENQKAVGLLIKNVRYLIKHYKFRVLKGHFVYGSEDPATVGQVLMYLSLLHPLYGREFSIEPVFNRPVMKGDMNFKGHIRLIHLLVSIVELMMNKKIRLVVANHFKGD